MSSPCASTTNQNESQSVELGEAESVSVEIDFGAGELKLAGGAEELLEADFTYNVASLEPEVKYTDGTLVVRQPEVKGLPVLRDMDGYRNEWDLRFNEEVPMDLSVTVGAGTSDLQLAGLSLTGLDINQGAGETTVDLSGDWANNLDVTIDAGAGEVTLRLPGEVGARVEVNAGLGEIKRPAGDHVSPDNGKRARHPRRITGESPARYFRVGESAGMQY